MATVGEVITNKLGNADLAVLERYGDPKAILALGEDGPTSFIAASSNGNHGAKRARAWLPAARGAVELYGDDPAVACGDVAAELATEARTLRLLEAHVKAREAAHQKVDTAGLARSLPGVAKVGGPVTGSGQGRQGSLLRVLSSSPSPGSLLVARARGRRARRREHHQSWGPAP
jgi:hypothetical protein